jgi:hypothetical protein
MRFRDYLSKRRPTDSGQSEFIKVALSDPQMPDAESWPQLQAHLLKRAAPLESAVAALRIWKGYRRAAQAARVRETQRPLVSETKQ